MMSVSSVTRSFCGNVQVRAHPRRRERAVETVLRVDLNQSPVLAVERAAEEVEHEVGGER